MENGLIRTGSNALHRFASALRGVEQFEQYRMFAMSTLPYDRVSVCPQQTRAFRDRLIDPLFGQGQGGIEHQVEDLSGGS